MEEIAAKTAMRADRAERLLETLQRRNPAEADLQASAMVMAGLKMLQQVRGTTSVLDSLSRIGPALVAECQAEPAVTHPDADTMPGGHAGELYSIVAARPPAEGRAQADAMMNAATALLIDREGIDNTIAELVRLADRVRASKVAPAPAPAQAEDLVGGMLAYLRGLPLEVAKAQARAAAVAASAFLAEVGAAPAVVVPGSAAEPVAPLPAGQLALAMVDELKTMPRWEAHERARSVVAGSAAYLHEVFGRSYASAVLNGTLQAAADYGTEANGGRDSCDVLH